MLCISAIVLKLLLKHLVDIVLVVSKQLLE
jgi:hypothetical protein